MMDKELKDFIFAALNDDYGISTEAWEHLYDFLHNAGEFEILVKLGNEVEATDGRFYIK